MLRVSATRRFVEYVPQSVTLKAAFAAANNNNNNNLDTTSIHDGTALFRKTEREAARSDKEREKRGFFSLPKLMYPIELGVAPIISAKQLRHIYYVVHQSYVDRLNRMTLGHELEGHSLETVIRQSSFNAMQNAIHTPACEHFNHCFFYMSVRPWGTSTSSALREALQLQYKADGSSLIGLLTKLFVREASTMQNRSGWVYLVWTGTRFDIVAFEAGTTPIASDLIPLLGLSLNESAYGLDYDVVNPTAGLEKYIGNFFKCCNWNVAGRYYAEATGRRKDEVL